MRRIDKGISIIGAVFTLLVLAVFGAAIVVLVSADSEMRFRELEKEQAFYEVQAGLEYAVHEITNGGYPLQTNKALGRGTFTTTVDFPNHYVYATGTSGITSNTHRITVNPMEGDCLFINPNSESLGGPGRTDLSGIILQKTCLNSINVDKIQLTWSPNGGQKITNLTIYNVVLYNNATGSGSGVVIDSIDRSISDGTNHTINLIRFTGDMRNKQINMVVFLTDSSYKTSTFTIGH